MKKKWYDFLFQTIEAGDGTRKLRAPVAGLLLIIMLVIGGAIILFTDWRCGPCNHDASDVRFRSVK